MFSWERLKLFLFGRVYEVEYSQLAPLLDEHYKPAYVGFDGYENLEDVAAWLTQHTGELVVFSSSKGFRVCVHSEADYVKWRLSWL